MQAKKSPDITPDIWREYIEKRDTRTRNYILMEYLHIVKCIAARIYMTYKNYNDQDDIVSCGTIALMNAIDRFNPDRGIKFETYASIRVRGAMLDFMRKQDWVSRSARKSIRDVNNAYDVLRDAGSPTMPSDSEVAEYLGIEVGELHEHLGNSYAASILSMEELISNNMTSQFRSEDPTPEEIVENSEFSEALERGIDQLSEKERIIISLYYYEGLKAKHIAGILNISESRISQLHSKALIKLKMYLNKFDWQ